MFKATKLIAEELTRRDLKFQTIEKETYSRIRIGFNNETESNEEYFLYSGDDDNDVLLRSGVIVSVPAEKTDSMLELLNEFNDTYRFFSFYLDEDNDVIMKLTFPVRTADSDVGKVAFEMISRANNIHEDIYPKLMKCLWC